MDVGVVDGNDDDDDDDVICLYCIYFSSIV